MRKVKVVFITVILFAWVLPAISQPVFYSQSLRKLFYSLPSSCSVNSPVADTVVLCTEIMQGITVPVAYCWDGYGMLAHIGYRFLPGSDTASLHPAVVRFLERELLSLLTTDDLKQKLTINRDNGLTLLLNGTTPPQGFYRGRNDLPLLLQKVSGMNIRLDEERRYRVDLNCGQGQTLSFHFVADAELLSDMDKDERDKRIAAQLSQHHAKATAVLPHIPACNNVSLQPFHDSVYLCRGASFIIPQMNRNLYYRKTDGMPVLVFSREQVAESFSNAMLVPAISDYSFNIIQSLYGGAVRKYEVKSSDFYDYFSGDYDLYFGLEPPTGNKLLGTLILSNRNTSVIHLAHVSISIDDLMSGGTMDMRLHTNIPLHNILTLFGEGTER